MSLDRTPSPQPNGGWASPGLTNPYDDHPPGPTKRYTGLNGGPSVASGVTWASAKASSARVKGVPSYQSQNQGFFGRHMRRISAGLPLFLNGADKDRHELKEKPIRSRAGRFSSPPLLRDLPASLSGLLSKKQKSLFFFLFVLTSLLLWFHAELTYAYRRTSWLGGGSKFVIILAANEEGGVMYWKGAREWAIERDSVKNKRRYAEKWGYDLEIVDMSTKKKYAHEWRESWEKADFIRNAMKKYPDAEWFWWLDLNTFIMEPKISLQKHIFNNLAATTYRDINLYNPLGIQHPPTGTSADPDAPPFANYLDAESASPVGDGKPESINMVITQDCGGFNLGSFFTRRSAWTDRLLDIWWDPVFYEQRHMEWDHKEQDALEYLYINQPWVRPHLAFAPQRLFNAFPNVACGDDRGIPAQGCPGYFYPGTGEHADDHECGVQGVHYQERERDFFVNMAGCEWGRDCWGEIYNFRQLSNRLNRNPWEKFKDFFSESWDAWKHPPPPPPSADQGQQ